MRLTEELGLNLHSIFAAFSLALQIPLFGIIIPNVEIFIGNRLIKNHFDRNGEAALITARNFACQNYRGTLGVESLMVGLSYHGAFERISGRKIDSTLVPEIVRLQYPITGACEDLGEITRGVQQIIERSHQSRLFDGKRKINSDHLLRASLGLGNPLVIDILQRLGIPDLAQYGVEQAERTKMLISLMSV